MTIEEGVARDSSRNSSRATTTVKARILRFLDDNPRSFLVKKIAQEVGAHEGYVRKCLRELAAANIIHCKDLGIAKEYSTKCYFPANLYRVKQSPGVPLPQVHGLALLTNYTVARNDNHGFGFGDNFVFNKYYVHQWSPGRVLRYKFGSNGSLDVRLQATLNPLSFEDFKQFLTFLEGFFRLPVWSALDKWTITQYGLNKDIFTMETNERITLAALGNFFSQVYDKTLLDTTPVQRYEYHVNEPIVANAFMELFQGGVSAYVQQQLAFSTNQLTREQSTDIRGLTRAIENLLEQLRRRLS